MPESTCPRCGGAAETLPGDAIFCFACYSRDIKEYRWKSAIAAEASSAYAGAIFVPGVGVIKREGIPRFSELLARVNKVPEEIARAETDRLRSEIERLEGEVSDLERELDNVEK